MGPRVACLETSILALGVLYLFLLCAPPATPQAAQLHHAHPPALELNTLPASQDAPTGLIATNTILAGSEGEIEHRVLAAYLAYYGRPADPAGLAYWSERLRLDGGNLENIIDEFGESQEFLDRFSGTLRTAIITSGRFSRPPKNRPEVIIAVLSVALESKAFII